MNQSNVPVSLFTTRLKALEPRIDGDDVVACATSVREAPDVLTDPRLAEALLQAIYQVTSARILLAWDDGSLGFAYFPPGKKVAEAVHEAYSTARGVLESVHLDHAPVEAGGWKN